MLEEGIIGLFDSEWASPTVLVKKDGIMRLCVDYHQLNAAMKTDTYISYAMD